MLVATCVRVQPATASSKARRSSAARSGQSIRWISRDESVSSRTERHQASLLSVGETPGGSRRLVALAREDDAVHRVLDHRFGRDGGAYFDLRDLDQLGLRRATAVIERGEQCDPGVHTDDGIGRTWHIARRTLRQLVTADMPDTCSMFSAAARRNRATGRRGRLGMPTAITSVRSATSRSKSSRTAPPLAGEVLHHDARPAGQPTGEVAAGRRAQIERDVALIQVGGLPQWAALVPVLALERLGA